MRWQRPGEPEGLHGIQQPVLMRDPAVPNLQIDWSPVDASRHFEQAKYLTEMVNIPDYRTTIIKCLSV